MTIVIKKNATKEEVEKLLKKIKTLKLKVNKSWERTPIRGLVKLPFQKKEIPIAFFVKILPV